MYGWEIVWPLWEFIIQIQIDSHQYPWILMENGKIAQCPLKVACSEQDCCAGNVELFTRDYTLTISPIK